MKRPHGLRLTTDSVLLCNKNISTLIRNFSQNTPTVVVNRTKQNDFLHLRFHNEAGLQRCEQNLKSDYDDGIQSTENKFNWKHVHVLLIL